MGGIYGNTELLSRGRKALCSAAPNVRHTDIKTVFLTREKEDIFTCDKV